MKTISLFILSIIFSCHTSLCQPAGTIFQPGDILFQDLDCGPLCDAIEKVTYGFQERDFSHVGIVVRGHDEQLYVIEAIGAHVRKTPIADFFKRSEKVLGGRLIPEYQKLIVKACKKAEEMVGLPYDNRFIMNNDSLYCSELIYEVFKTSNKGKPLFDLMPMTFKDPQTGVTFKAWTDYYHELLGFIPEGEPGINPGLISRSEKLIIIYDFKNSPQGQ